MTSRSKPPEEPWATRAVSLRTAASLGFPHPPAHLPQLDRDPLRPEEEVVERALALNLVIGCSWGMPMDLARAWLEREQLADRLTPGEIAFLADVDRGEDPESSDRQIQVEGLWVLAWALGLERTLDFGACCGDHLVSLLPDLRRDESRDRFETAAKLRPYDEIHGALDLAYCLTWGAAEANLMRRQSPGAVLQYVLWERRRALEWLFGADWDDPPMDT